MLVGHYFVLVWCLVAASSRASGECNGLLGSCAVFLQEVLAGHDACKVGKGCFRAQAACEVVRGVDKSNCSEDLREVCQDLEGFNLEELLCSRVDEARMSEKENTEQDKDEKKKAKADLEEREEENTEGKIKQFTTGEKLMAVVFSALALVCLYCCWARVWTWKKKLWLPSPMPEVSKKGKTKKRKGILADLWRNIKLTRQQRRLVTLLQEINSLLGNPMLGDYLVREQDHLIEEVYTKIGMGRFGGPIYRGGTAKQETKATSTTKVVVEKEDKTAKNEDPDAIEVADNMGEARGILNYSFKSLDSEKWGDASSCRGSMDVEGEGDKESKV